VFAFYLLFTNHRKEIKKIYRLLYCAIAENSAQATAVAKPPSRIRYSGFAMAKTLFFAQAKKRFSP